MKSKLVKKINYSLVLFMNTEAKMLNKTKKIEFDSITHRERERDYKNIRAK